TMDGAVVEAAVSLLTVGAVFQIFDGLQTCAMGALRGIGDTRTAMLCHLIAYWAIGLPAGYVLFFSLKGGVVGVVIGLCVALILIGVVLTWVWSRSVKSIALRTSAASAPGA